MRCLIALGLSWFVLAPASAGVIPLKWWTRTSWHRLEGARCTNVRKFLQTKDGYIWMASENGLIRFDGRDFLTLGYRTQPAFHVNDVMDIVASPDGSLWVATMDGLLRYQTGVFDRFEASDGLPSSVINCLLLDGGRLWVGTDVGAAVRIGGVFHPVPSVTGTGRKRAPVVAMVRLPEEGIFAVSGRRLVHLETEDMAPLAVTGLSGNPIALQAEGASGLWVGTTKGLFQVDVRNLKATRISGVAGQVEAIAPAPDGSILLGTRFHGLLRVREGKVEHYSELNGLCSGFVRSVMVDREGSIWVGTSQGVDCLKSLPIHNIGKTAGLLHPHVDSVVTRSDGTLLVATQEGVQQLNLDGEFVQTPVTEPITSLCALPSGGFLAGSWKGDLIFNPERGRPHALLSKVGLIYVVMHQPGAGIWVGTGRGLFQAESVKGPFRPVPGLSAQDVRCLSFQGRTCWAGTGKGLNQLENGKVVRQWFQDDGMSSNYVFCLLSDGDDTLWVGTDQGLSRFRNGKWVSVDYRHGLPSNSVYGLMADDRGNLWLSMGEGIGVISRDQLNREMDAGTIRSMRAFGRMDGLASDGGVGGTQPVIAASPDGRLWFATGGGVAMVDPGDIPRNDVPPPVVIQQVTVDGRLVYAESGVVLKPGWKRFSVTYAGLSYQVPERVRYRYLLAGFETDWKTTSDRTLSYTNLDPGTYTFMVHAANNDGVWSTQPATLSVQVVAPWWRTRWFYGLIVLLAGVAVNLVVRGTRRMVRVFLQWRRTHVFGPYRVLDVIGKGGMGTVYRAEDTRTGDIVALKAIDPDVTDEDGRSRFEREGLIGMKIHHPNVVPVLDRGRSGDRLYYAMTYIEGRRLREIMDEGIGLKTALAIAAVLMDVANDLHLMGVVHRDLKPENVVIDDELNLVGVAASQNPVDTLRAHVHLLDFGVARLFGATTLTRTGLVTGTLQYVPPEALSGTKHADAAMDFYAIGVMLYEMVTGVPPYDGEDPSTLMYAILYRSPIPPIQVSVHVPKAVSDLIVRMLEKQRKDRLADYAEIRQKLELLLTGC